MAHRGSDAYRRLLQLSYRLTTGTALSADPAVVNEFLELASASVAMDDSVPSKAYVDLPAGRGSRMTDSVERLFSAAIARCGIDDLAGRLLLAASINALRTAAIAEEPTLLHEEDVLAG
jgi:hypothetical protein